jgi:hypothetical protein
MASIKSTEQSANSVKQELISQRRNDRANKFPVGSSEGLRDAVSVGITLCGHFEDVVEALHEFGIPKVLVKATKIAEHVPQIGMAFSLLMPILEKFAAAHEVAEEIPGTLKRISRLTNSLATKLRRLRKSCNRENDKLEEDIKEIADLLENGINTVNTIVKNKNGGVWYTFSPANGHKEKLEAWNKEADRVLQDRGHLAAIMTYTEVVNLMDVLAFRHYVTLVPILSTLVLAVLIHYKVIQVLAILTRSVSSRVATMASDFLAWTYGVVTIDAVRSTLGDAILPL